MASGGARARSGPPPDRNAVRNGRAGADWIRLPASGRKADPPAFPLPRPTIREKAVWAGLWTKPQALMWEAAGQEREVANFVRTQVEAEKRGAAAALRTLVLRMEEHLGLSQPGLARNRWLIVDDKAVAGDAPTADDGTGRAPIPISDARDRLRRMGDAG
jgi:hypothetical protein